MSRIRRWAVAQRSSLDLAAQALRAWGPSQVIAAVGASLVVALVVGVATVLIPNPVFGRDIPPVAWNYPVWIVTSILMGMLLATYIRPPATAGARATPAGVAEAEALDEQRSARFGATAGVLAWFAVGCPVCNKIALVALGHTGALTWFAPFQPVLAAAAIALSTVALVWRLRGQVLCPTPAPSGLTTR